MKLTPIDNANRLWAISDIWPEDLINDVLSIDWLNEPFAYETELLGDQNRRNVFPKNPIITRLDDYMHQCVPLINQITNNNFISSPASCWWINEPGFRSNMHHDGGLLNNMLVYWYAPDKSEEYGTTFYNSDNTSDVLHQFKSVPGTGYFMLNHVDPDGTRPIQLHAMLNIIPPNHWRLTSFWQF